MTQCYSIIVTELALQNRAVGRARLAVLIR